MRYPIKDKFWEWRMDLFEVFAYWDSWRTSPTDIDIDMYTARQRQVNHVL